VAWIVDHETDVASDLSAFHRIDEPMSIPGARYFDLAARLPAYPGVMQAVALAERERDKAPASGAPVASQPASAPRHVDDTALLASLAADGWVEHARGSDA
jgi:hypothetical protein